MRERRTKRLKEQGVINRRLFGRKEKSASPRWWWDPPKLIPILISVIALCVSGLSWWESHRGRLINEEINRPVLALSRSKHNHPAPSSDRPNIIFFFVTLKNIGKLTAIVKGGEVTPEFITSENPACKVMTNPDSQVPDPGISSIPEEIFPNSEAALLGSILLTPECYKQKISFSVSTRVIYSDTISGPEKRYAQWFSEATEILLDSSEVE